MHGSGFAHLWLSAVPQPVLPAPHPALQAWQSSSALSPHSQAAKSQMPTAPLPSHYHFLRFPKQIVRPIKLCVNCVTVRIKCVYFQMTWSFWLPCLKVTKSSSKKEERKWKTTTGRKGKGNSSLRRDLGKCSLLAPHHLPSTPTPQ